MAAPSYSNEDMMAGNENGTSHNNNNTTGASSAAATLPLSSVLEHTYTSLIQQYLAVHCLDNATFYAERLVATSKTSHSLYLLALCYYRHQKPQRVRYLLEQEANTATSPELMYLLAQSCFDQEDYSAAEEALLRQVRRDFSKTESSNINEYILTATPCPIPNGAAGLQLLAKVCAKSSRKQRAITYHQMALQLDPFLWTSWEALCDLGATDVHPSQVFGVALDEAQTGQWQAAASLPPQQPQRPGILTPAIQTPHQAGPGASEKNNNAGILQPSAASHTMTTPASSMHRTTLFPNSNAATNHNAPATAGFETPNLTPIPNEQSFAAANTRAVQRARKVVFRDYYQPSPENTSYSNNKPRSLFFSGLDASDVAAIAATPVSQQHTSLFSAAGAETELSNPNTNIAARPGLSVVPRQRPNYGSEGDHVTSQTGETPSYDAVQCILQLLCLMGTAQWHLGHFRSKHAIQLFERLPEEQYNTGWVLHQVGRAHFAMADYANAIRSLQLMEQVEPHRMAGLEVLSTALWQTKREVDLSHLAQRVADFDRLSAEVWCVVGNCFSLQKEHETALTFFRRSIQLDPSFTYSHTLSGHEYFANEDFDKAIACYRDAIRADERHYNAWYGLGAVYYRQEKFDLAEYHFHRACSINPQSSVLICHLGMAQNANGKQYESLDTLQAAFRLDPHNPQAHYQRSLVFQALDRNEEALMELVKVRDAAPREAQIYYSMGRLYKKLGRTEKAMRCFLDALDLDPKDTNLIKSAMEKMDEPDVEEEISAF